MIRMTRGTTKVVKAINDFVSNISRDSDKFGAEFKGSVVREIVRERAIDTTLMIQAIDFDRNQVVDSGHDKVLIGAMVGNHDVFYDGFVEFETANRDGTMRRGRYVYKKGIENANVERVVNEIARESFVI